MYTAVCIIYVLPRCCVIALVIYLHYTRQIRFGDGGADNKMRSFYSERE